MEQASVTYRGDGLLELSSELVPDSLLDRPARDVLVLLEDEPQLVKAFVSEDSVEHLLVRAQLPLACGRKENAGW